MLSSYCNLMLSLEINPSIDHLSYILEALVLQCVPLGLFRPGIMIQDHSDHGASKETDESFSRVDSSVP